MELISPLTAAREVEPLVKAGATELYAGVLTRGWKDSFSTFVSNNDRDSVVGNFSELEELREAVDRAHEFKVSVHLTLNPAYYTAAQADHLARLMDDAVDVGVDGFLISDLPTMLRARREHPDISVHISTISPAFNSAALAFYAGLGAERAILPQHLTPDELVDLARNPALDLEVFVLNDRCINVDGFCTFMDGLQEAEGPRSGGLGRTVLHSRAALMAARHVPRRLLRMARRLPGLRPEPCLLDYGTEPVTVGPVSLEGIAAARSRMEGHFHAKTGIDCGACVLRTLMNSGVKAVKIAGRSNDTRRKLQDVHFIAGLLRLAEDDNIGDEELYTRTQKAFREGYSGSCRDEVCYYRTFLPRA